MHLNAADRYDNHMRAFVRSCPHLRMTVPLELLQGRSREGNGHLRFGVLGMSVGLEMQPGGLELALGFLIPGFLEEYQPLISC